MASAANRMDVDSPTKQDEELKVSVHPLAIVNMSDQYTRITCGGSPLNPDAPVVGLLFGRSHTDAGLQILDSDDIPVRKEGHEAAARQVSLHQAVFPQSQVVGWYRVSSLHDQPTADDLNLTFQLQERYAASSTATTTTRATPFVFSLLQAPNSSGDTKPAPMGGAQKNDDDDKDLPFTLYQLAENNKSLLAVENWSLETSEPERIAIEHVVRAQPPSHRRPRHASTHKTAESTKSSPFCEGAQDVQYSVEMMRGRLAVLEQFLVDTKSGKIPWQPALLRQVQGLLWQLGPLMATIAPIDTSTTTSSTSMVQQLALLTKTVDAVQSYTDKFRVVHETSPSLPSSRPYRETRRGLFHHA